MEQSPNIFGDDEKCVSAALFASKMSLKAVKRVSKQLARPNVAGFQARLDKEDYSALLKQVASDKIDVLLDEFMVEVRFCARFFVSLCTRAYISCVSIVAQ